MAERLAALERSNAALTAALEELRQTAAALRRRIEDATAERMEADATHDKRLSAIEESIPPRRLRIVVPATPSEPSKE